MFEKRIREIGPAALLLGVVLAWPTAAAADSGNELNARVDTPMQFIDDGVFTDEQRSAARPRGVIHAIPRDRNTQYQLLGQLPSQTLRFGPLVVYNNTFFCDPNDLTLLDFNRTSGAGGIFEGFVDVLCANGSLVGGCDPNACDPNTLTGPAYYQDSAASIPAEVNGISFMYMTDHSNAPSFVPPDLNMDGSVDLTDFALFAPCFGQPAAGGCLPMDFDSSGTVGGPDFALFSQCFGGATNPPAPGCPFGQGGGGGNQIDIDLCFSVGTDSGSPGVIGTLIVNDFSGNGGSSASRAIYRCVDLPPDNAPGDDALAFIFVDVDLMASPPVWTAERPIDSAVFSGAVLKDGAVPADADRTFLLPGGSFGINIGAPDGSIEDLNTLMAFGGQGQQNVMRFLDASPAACLGNGDPCGTLTSPDLLFLFTATNGIGQTCTFDNCNTCPVDNTGLFLQLLTAELPGEPNETIDDNLPTTLVGAGCATLTAEIGGGQGPTDVDMYKVFLPAPPPDGWKLSAYAEAVGGTPETRGNPLIRIFDNAGLELASNDSDGRPENNVLGCPPQAGVNALAGVTLTAGGTYWVAVSGGGCDEFLPANHPTMPCEPDPAATCNDAYDPLAGTGTMPGDEGVYTLTIGVGDLSQSSEAGGLNDSIPLATPIASLPFDSGAGAFTFGDGPFAACLGDADYYTVPDAVSTDGNFLDIATESNSTGANTDSFMAVYETDAGSPTANKRLVAVHDNEAASFDSRCLVPVLASKDYHIMVMGVGLSGGGGPDTRGTCFRQFGGFTEYLPGMNDQMPGAGDAVPGAGGVSLTGSYRLVINQRTEGVGFGQVPPAGTGPFEPNDSMSQAASNAVLTVVQNQALPTSETCFMGDGRYSWAIGLVPTVIGDVDIYKVEGLDPNDLLEAVAGPVDLLGTVALFSYIAREADGGATGQIIATPAIRLLFPSGAISSLTLTPIQDPNDTYVVVISDDARTDFGFFGNFMPWDLTVPGTLLMGQFTGPYQLSLKSRSQPPAAAPGSRMWGVYRGTLNNSILELNPNTGTIINQFNVPTGATVSGGTSGLALAQTPPGHTADVLYYLNTQGALSPQSRLWHLDPNNGSFVPTGPGSGFVNLNLDPFILSQMGTGDIISMDGLGFAGGKLWMTNQNTKRMIRWNTASRQGDGVIIFTASPFFRDARDGLEGIDNSSLGSGSVLYVAARDNRTIVVADIGTDGNGPNAGATLQDRVVNLGEFPDPTFDGGASTANCGAIAVIPTAGALRLGPSNVFNIYIGNINAFVTDVVQLQSGGLLRGQTSTVVGGWQQSNFGASGYTQR